ncbi:hypothetical protein HPB47_008242 [Ixodes persulcatus]|uniref:Uncharacterized protein n=1 Tax=Ixodes persulcatus TaxID=34615 RepID=A0AC60P5D5_IXOPE|nr:hypothetical protein HPB47_008242 [Ixodes persulcatus]
MSLGRCPSGRRSRYHRGRPSRPGSRARVPLPVSRRPSTQLLSLFPRSPPPDRRAPLVSHLGRSPAGASRPALPQHVQVLGRRRSPEGGPTMSIAAAVNVLRGEDGTKSAVYAAEAPASGCRTYEG